MWTFIVTLAVSLVTTVLFTAIDIKVRGGRVPIISFPYDEEKEEQETAKKVDECDDNEDIEEKAYVIDL